MGVFMLFRYREVWEGCTIAFFWEKTFHVIGYKSGGSIEAIATGKRLFKVILMSRCVRSLSAVEILSSMAFL